MRAIWGIALLHLVFANAALAQADLQITSTATPSAGLVAGQEFLVSTTIRNNGPGAATSVNGSLSLTQQEFYWFELVGSATPGCDIQFIEIDPPTFLIAWSYAALAAGQSQTCVARLRVRFVPPEGTTQLFAHVDSQPVDPVAGNDDATIPLFFNTFPPAARHTIPAASMDGLLFLALCTLAAGVFPRFRGRA